MAEDKQYGSGSIVDIDRLTKLKAKVKAECLRRKYTDSVENYGSSTYDFSNNPTVGGVIKREYYDKNATPLNAINNSLVPKANITDAENVALNNEIYNCNKSFNKIIHIIKFKLNETLKRLNKNIKILCNMN